MRFKSCYPPPTPWLHITVPHCCPAGAETLGPVQLACTAATPACPAGDHGRESIQWPMPISPGPPLVVNMQARAYMEKHGPKNTTLLMFSVLRPPLAGDPRMQSDNNNRQRPSSSCYPVCFSTLCAVRNSQPEPRPSLPGPFRVPPLWARDALPGQAQVGGPTDRAVQKGAC